MRKYKTATTERDYEMVEELILREHMEPIELRFPTLMAMDDDKLVGALGTFTLDDMIIAGPMVLKSDKRRAMTAMRLIDKYEESMLHIGIKSVIFFVDMDSSVYNTMKRVVPGWTPYAMRDGKAFYIWRIGQDKFAYTDSEATPRSAA